jgi:hypothetical protein
MIVEVRIDGSVALLEAQNTRDFKLVASQRLTEEDLIQALARVADVASGHAWVFQHWIREKSPLAASADWQNSFSKMLDYARSKNWLRDTDGAIRVHIEKN